ncbi:FkbM family methyltransferase [Sedimentibacter sp.]|uniref:FkbM family methyltransferase n=1 Tax=Sedimentibacter sp. TaxID=1960295 RepID=UPI00289F2C22|nr:FkbM family methyltransferase [Sedimentibacter sp.]
MEVTYDNFIKLLTEKMNVGKREEKSAKVLKAVECINNGGNIYIWPSGRIGRKVFEELELNGYKKLILVDENSRGCNTINPNDVIFDSKDVLVVSTLTFSKEIYNLALKMNCNNILMYYDVKELGNISPIVFPEDFWDKCFESLRNHLLENPDRYKNMYFSLEDDVSKKALLNNIFFRLTNDIRYTFECDEGIQYFDNSIINFNKEEILIDAGGYTGDTLEKFLSLNIPFKAYYLFEPDKGLMEQAKNKVQDIRVHYINKGLFSKSGEVKFKTTMGLDGHIIKENKYNEDEIDIIECVAIDTYINDKVTFIKMDIEGAELEALKGAEKTIKKYYPTLAISIYHKPSDYLDIFEYIRTLNPKYKFYLRQHANFYAENVLYAVV